VAHAPILQARRMRKRRLAVPLPPVLQNSPALAAASGAEANGCQPSLSLLSRTPDPLVHPPA